MCCQVQRRAIPPDGEDDGSGVQGGGPSNHLRRDSPLDDCVTQVSRKGV
jgi:hypothetical protein